MRTKFLYLAVCVITFFMVACTEKNEYTNVIPKDASLVISADLKQMADKGGLTGEDGKILVGQLEKSMKGELTDDELGILGKVLENPDESGLDFQKKVYLFATSGLNYGAFLAAVDDIDKLNSLTELLVSQDVCSSFIDVEGYKYSAIGDKSVIMYDGTAFLILFNEGETYSESLKDVAVKWLSNTKDNSFTVTDEFGKINSLDSDIIMAGSLATLPKDQAKILSMNLPAGINLNDIVGVFSVNFEKGRVLVDIETMFKTDDARKQAEKQEKIYKGKLKGKFLDKFVGNSVFYASASCDGEEAYKMLMENEMVKSQLDAAKMPVDLKNVLGSLDGEISIAVAPGNFLPQVAVYAEVEGDDILKEVDDYKLALSLAQVKYGVEDGVFYMTNMETPKSGASLDDNNLGTDSKGKLTYLSLDFNSMSEMLGVLGNNSPVSQMKVVAQYLKSVTLYNDDITHSHIIFTATNSDTNVLKQIVDFGRKMSGVE